jgi:hypothetical protein
MTTEKAIRATERAEVHPTPSCTENNRHAHHGQPQSLHAQVIERAGAALGLRGQDNDDQGECRSNRDRTEPEGGAVVVELCDQ